LPIRQGEIFEIDSSPWIVVDSFHNDLDAYRSLHCAPVLSDPDLRLELDVALAFEGGYASLGLMKKQQKGVLQRPLAIARSLEVEEIRSNLIRTH
jgi:hypothetical protein